MAATSVPTDIKFTGQRLDATGLYYYNAQYYDATIGRFISPDTFVPWSTGVDVIVSPLSVNIIPAGLGSLNAPQGNYPAFTFQKPVNPQNFNRYSYVLNNPLQYTDPSGWWTFSIGLSFKIDIVATVSFGFSFAFDGEGNKAITCDTERGLVTDVGAGLSVVVNSTEIDNIFSLSKKDTYTDYLTAGVGAQGTIGNISSKGEKIGNTYSIGLGAGVPPLAVGGGYSNSDILWSNKMFEDFTGEDFIYGMMNIIDSEAAYYYDYYNDYQWDNGYNYNYYYDTLYWDYLYYSY